MKKVYGLLCIVAIFALASCGQAEEIATDAVENTTDAVQDAGQVVDDMANSVVEVVDTDAVADDLPTEEEAPAAMMDAEATASGEVMMDDTDSMMDAEATASGEVMMEEVLPTE